MMGRTHALTGWCGGLAVAPLVGVATGAPQVVFAATTAGFALLPDLDHPGATATRLLGWFTRAVSWLLRKSSARLYAATKGPRDERCTGTHRHLSHTVLFALALGGAAAVGAAAGGPWAVLAVVMLGLLLAAAVLGDWVLLAGLAGGGWMAAHTDAAGALTEVGGFLGAAVTLGCIVHDLGDAITEAGCPFLFPLLIAGETWYEIRPPRWLRFRTGKTFEKLVVFPAFAVLGVVLAPGVLDAVRQLAFDRPPTA
jgi:hypothetical protein